MSVDATPETPRMMTIPAEWEPPSPPTDLIFDDGEPLESNRHRIAMDMLIRLLKHFWAERQNFFVGGNMFIYYSSRQVRNRDFRGPDFFAVLDVDRNPARQGWVVWDEDGRYPDVIIELLSASTAEVDKTLKKDLYEQVFKTRDYFVYDPFDVNSLQGWSLDDQQRYQPISSNSQGWLWSNVLGVWLGTWSGQIEDDTATWLRFYDHEGNLVPLPEEAAVQQAEQAQQQAEQAQQQAEQAQQQAEQAQQQLQQERQLREQLLEKLQRRGINPDEL